MYNADIPGWMTIPELQHIETLAASVPEHGTVLEVGSFYGRSTWCWSKSVPETATVTCIDPWNGFPVVSDHMHGKYPEGDLLTTRDMFETNVEDCHNLKVIQGYSSHVMPSLMSQSFDIVFLDGMHDDKIFPKDLIFGYALLKPGGILCGHDFHESHPDVVKHVGWFAGRFGLRIEIKPLSTIWVLRI